MAAITGEPLPEGALDDAGFAAEHRSALADVALLREQLGLIGEALAASGRTVNDTEAEAVPPPGRPKAARPASGTEDTARPVQETGTETRPAPAPTPPVRSVPTRSVPTRSVPARAPGRRRRRVPALAFGTLAAAVAATLVMGLGWLISQSGMGIGVSSGDNASSAKHEDGGRADSEADSGAGSGNALSPPYVACARLIVEGTVASVEPVPGTGQNRITLDVDRYYKPAKGEDEIVFPLEEGADPRLRKGERVLIGIPHDEAVPDLVATGKEEIARERALITEALPTADGLPCEDGG
ncbi:hypothetical protein FNH04_43520 [Streptomyces phyllanthi]|uniref:Uncharacterized protein n=2 Tax=Streptomyces phyllanthi TaxID=1803180 RepID=A0A5N8WGF8_9ACTN|nr:hypothetical protein [Streptomyces phyllanthi]MPY46533.1 hypothetical protein [Streptomyces phyllanthi]